MKNHYAKKIFIFTAVCAVLLLHFAFFAVQSANAEETGDFTVRTPTFQLPPEPTLNLGISKGELIELSPEIKRLDQELNQAKPNEEAAGPAGGDDAPSEKCYWWQPTCIILHVLDGIVSFVIALPLTISEFFFDRMVIINLEGAAYRSGFVSAGWGISRDIANMFFIFFVLWMALATIFQLENYSAKRLLPKLIIVALLVNFSLPIGRFVIDVSNAIAGVFYQTATNGDSLAQQISGISRLNSTKQAAEFSNKTRQVAAGTCKQKIGDPTVGIAKDVSQLTLAYEDCMLEELQKTTKGIGGKFIYGLISIFWKLIIGLIASFVFFAGAIFFLIRYLSLVILLIFGPLAFLFMILPATQEHWNKWWTKLTQWSFFAPAFMFMIMLSVRLANTLLTFQNKAAQIPATNNDLPSLALQYILVMGLFIASLSVANTMGIYMSGTVVGWGRSMARGAGRYAKGASFRGAARMGGAYAKMALETPQARRMAATPLVRGLLRPLEAAIGAKRGVEEERAKQIANAVRSGNPAYAAARLQGERATVQAAYLRSASKDDIQKLEQGMGAGAMGVMMNQLKSIAPELGKKIGQSFKDIDLRIAAAKGVAIGTPEFERAREEYMSEQTPYALGQILTAENLQKQWVQKYLLARGGEKEINAITQTGEQIRGLASIFEQWGDAEMRNNTQLGNEIRQNIAMGQSFGYSPEQARRETMISYLPELFEKQAQQMGIATNQALQKWAQAAPARVMLGEGRVIQRGTDMDELLRRLSGGGGTAPQSPPPGGPATQ